MSDAPPNPPEPETPRREFQFKPPEFERANRPVNESQDSAPIDVRQLYRQAGSPPPAPGAIAPSQADNEIHAILRANVARAEAQGLNQVIPQRRRPSRRKRDFWLLFVSGNLLVVASVSGLHRNAVTLVFGLSAIVMFSLGLIWVMWVVMDDY